MAYGLRVALDIRAIGCPNGQILGQDADLRVFDVQHAKTG
jgi:hypothetical protein